MKSFKLFIILMVLASVSPVIVAVTPGTEADQHSNVVSNVVRNEFGLSGMINRFDPKKSLIKIDGVKYILSGKGNLTDADLKPRLKIKYNLEQSSSEKIGRVTRIWIEEKIKK